MSPSEAAGGLPARLGQDALTGDPETSRPGPRVVGSQLKFCSVPASHPTATTVQERPPRFSFLLTIPLDSSQQQGRSVWTGLSSNPALPRAEKFVRIFHKILWKTPNELRPTQYLPVALGEWVNSTHSRAVKRRVLRPPTLQGEGGLGGAQWAAGPITSCSLPGAASSPVLFPWSSRMSPTRPFTLQSYPCLWEDHHLELAAELSPPGTHSLFALPSSRSLLHL